MVLGFKTKTTFLGLPITRSQIYLTSRFYWACFVSIYIYFNQVWEHTGYGCTGAKIRDSLSTQRWHQEFVFFEYPLLPTGHIVTRDLIKIFFFQNQLGFNQLRWSNQK